jgi:hypothetical protein
MVGGFVLKHLAMLLCYVIVFTDMVPLLTSYSGQIQTFHTGIYRRGNENCQCVLYRCSEFHSNRLVIIRDAFYLLLLPLTTYFGVTLTH